MAALTPFDPNIFFRRAASDTAQANQLQSAIGQLASAYKESKKAPDLASLAQSGAMKAISGQSDAITPEEMYAAEFMALQKPETISFDPLTKEPIVTPSGAQQLFSRMKGGYDITQDTSRLPRQGALSQVPQIDASMLEEGAPMNVGRGTPLPAMGAQDGSMPPITQQMAAPSGLNVNRATLQKMQDEMALQPIQESAEIRREERKKQDVSQYPEGKLKAAGFAERMISTANDIGQYMAEDPTSELGKVGTAGTIANFISAIPSAGMTDAMAQGIVHRNATPMQQKYMNAAQEWIRAKLRKESGAVIGAQEMLDEYNTYFPTAGDSPELIREKDRRRAKATETMIKESGGAYELQYGVKNAVQETQGQAPSQEINDLLEYMTPEERALFNGQ